MLKAAGIRGDRPFIMLGLSDGNIENLKQGMPIRVDLAEMGGTGDILIIYGKTESEMVQALQNAGIKLPGMDPN
jgi:hypothetical protein